MSKANVTRLEFRRADRDDRYAYFGDDASFEFWIKNLTTTAIEIDRMSVTLQPDLGVWKGHPSLVSHAEGLRIRIPSGGQQPAHLRVHVPLVCLPNTNYLGVTVQYRQDSKFRIGPSVTTSQDGVDYLIVRDGPATGESVFTSFADPEDLGLARLAGIYLRLCGFRPYLARDDTRTGCDFWIDKIEPAIRASKAVLVIWTSATQKRPDNVLREMAIARSASVPVGLFIGQGLAPPPNYPRDQREYLRFRQEDWGGDFGRGIMAASRRWRESSRLF